MLSLESDLYVMQCERRFDIERAERRIKHGLVAEIDNAGFGLPGWLTALGRRLHRRRDGGMAAEASGRPAPPAAIAVDAAPPARGRLCAGEHRRQRLVCEECGTVIRSVTPACRTAARRVRRSGDAARRQTV